jgi:uncharacterized protein (DUF4415 family)
MNSDPGAYPPITGHFCRAINLRSRDHPHFRKKATRYEKASTKISSRKRVKISGRTRRLYEARDKRQNEPDPDAPVMPPRFWERAEIGKFYRPLKTQISFRIDNDVLEWLKSKGERPSDPH